MKRAKKMRSIGSSLRTKNQFLSFLSFFVFMKAIKHINTAWSKFFNFSKKLIVNLYLERKLAR